MPELWILSTQKFGYLQQLYNYEFIYHGTDYVEYKKIHQTILDGSVYNMSVVIFEGKVYAIDAEYFSCQGYNTMKLFSYPYTLQ